MEPDDLVEFFLASAGAGAAFIGLLFVAISISPQRTFGNVASTESPRQHLAESTFIALANGFLVSSIALIPGRTIGWFALTTGLVGVLIAAYMGWIFARFHRHGHKHRAPRRHHLRVVSLSAVAVVICLIESLMGLRLVRDPTDAHALRGLALVIVALYTLGIIRAWILLGDPHHRWSGWLNPLQGSTVPHSAKGESE